MLMLKDLIDNNKLDDSFNDPFLRFVAKDTFNSILQNVFRKTNIPLSSGIILSAHGTRHFALSELNRIASETVGFSHNRLQNNRLEIGHTINSNQMNTNYNNYLYQASQSVVAMLSTDLETRSFSYSEVSSLKERFKMKETPGIRQVDYDIDNIYLFKFYFLEKFDIGDYRMYVNGINRSEKQLCTIVHGYTYVAMKKKFKSWVNGFSLECECLKKSNKRRKL